MKYFTFQRVICVNNIIITIDTINPKKKDKGKDQTTTNGLNEK